MKNYIKQFCLRGLLFAWGGPVVVAIVWLILHANGSMDSISPVKASIAIISSAGLAFLAAGISIVNQIEKLPKGFAFLIQGAFLYVIYVAIYLLNGWIQIKHLPIFSGIFAAVFVASWMPGYLISRHRVKKMNALLQTDGFSEENK